MNHQITKIGIFVLTLLMSAILHAKDIGFFGETYPILEEDFLQFIQKRIQTMQENGEWKKIQNQMQERVKSHADRPEVLKDITKATVKKEWSFDPSITLSHDLKDHEGRIFAKSGTTFNPLNMVPLRNALLFINSDDEKQVQWAQLKNRQLNNQTKIILVKGSIINTEKLFHQKIYFDQEGRLTYHFHIEHAPAIVTQEGLLLKIVEDMA